MSGILKASEAGTLKLESFEVNQLSNLKYLKKCISNGFKL